MYVFAVIHICTVYMHMTVCIYALCVCVCGHALHSGKLEQCYFVCTLWRPLVHLSLEANILLVLFFNGLLTDG